MLGALTGTSGGVKPRLHSSPVLPAEGTKPTGPAKKLSIPVSHMSIRKNAKGLGSLSDLNWHDDGRPNGCWRYFPGPLEDVRCSRDRSEPTIRTELRHSGPCLHDLVHEDTIASDKHRKRLAVVSWAILVCPPVVGSYRVRSPRFNTNGTSSATVSTAFRGVNRTGAEPAAPAAGIATTGQ